MFHSALENPAGLQRTAAMQTTVAWVTLILASMLPKIVLQEVFGLRVSGALQIVISLSVIGLALAATLFRGELKGLRPFFSVLLVFALSQWLVYNYLDRLAFFQAGLRNPSFSVSLLTEMSLNLIITLAMMATLYLLKKDRRAFFLARGQIGAPAAAVRWLGIAPGEPWSRLGPALTVYISLGTLTFLVIAGRPPADLVLRALPFLPAALLAAALNAFNEEVTYKASLLSALENPLGARQALLMTAAYFGVSHYYGVPYGVIGVFLAGFMGWLLSKSMLETRGLFWAWFVHFWQDVWIFAFMAIGSITPGG